MKKYANSRGALFAPSSGEAAQKAVFPAVAGQRLAALQRRQGQGLAGHGRHPEALTTRRRTMSMTATPPTGPRPSARARRQRPARRPRLDRVRHRRARRSRCAWTGSRRRHQPVHGAGPAAGLCSASSSIVLGVLLALAQLAPRRPPALAGPQLATSGESCAPARASCRPDRRLHVVLLGRGLPFWLGAALYVVASILLLQAPQRAAEGRALRCATSPRALAIGLASGWIITLGLPGAVPGPPALTALPHGRMVAAEALRPTRAQRAGSGS